MGNLSNLYISSSYQSLIHLGSDNTASSTLVGLQDGIGNSIGIGINTAGDLSISGSFTSSLQQGYVWVGNSSGKTTTVPTSSFGGGGGTGSADLSALNAFTSSQNTKNSTLATYTASVDTKFATIGSQSGSWGGGGSTFPYTGSAVITGSLAITGSFTISGSGILNGSPLVKSNQTGSFVRNISATSTPLTFEYDLGNGGTNSVTLVSSGGGIDTGSFATTGSNQFTGNQTITGSSRQVGLSIEESGTSGPDNFSRFFIGSKGNGTGNLIISSSANDRYIELDVSSGWMEVYAQQTNFNNNVALRNRTDIRNVFTDLGNGYTAQFDTISGSNANISGSLYVGGSTILSGSLYIKSGSTLPAATGSSVLTWNQLTGQVAQSPLANVLANTFSLGVFTSTITQSGSAAVSQSMTFNNTEESSGVTLSNNSRLNVATSGYYNIQFSAQLLADTGADDVWIWLKKNGTNVPNTGTRVTLANNEEIVAAWNFVVNATAGDYYQLVWQSVDGHATLLTEPASGNYPAIPSVIATVTQVR